MASKPTATISMEPPAPYDSVPSLAASATPTFFVHTAALEFQAALQLLVERARSLTGAAAAGVALEEDGHFVYSAVCGEFAGEVGSNANIRINPLRQCVEEGKSVCASNGKSAFTLGVPVLRASTLGGFFEVIGPVRFGDQDIREVERLSELVSTAIEHHQAAARAEKIGFEASVESSNPPVSAVWHAANLAEIETAAKNSAPSIAPPTLKIQKCMSCGFPVSPGRKLCVDCDKNVDSSHAPAELFSSGAEENWLSSHGYTIASVLVSVIAIAIILWLRAR